MDVLLLFETVFNTRFSVKELSWHGFLAVGEGDTVMVATVTSKSMCGQSFPGIRGSSVGTLITLFGSDMTVT